MNELEHALDLYTMTMNQKLIRSIKLVEKITVKDKVNVVTHVWGIFGEPTASVTERHAPPMVVQWRKKDTTMCEIWVKSR